MSSVLDKPTIRHYAVTSWTPYIVVDDGVTTSETALADTAYACEDDMYETETHAIQSFAYMELDGLLSSISWTLEHLSIWTIPEVKPGDWNEQFNANQKGCSNNLPHNIVTDAIVFKSANDAYRMHAMLDPYRKRIPLKLVEEDSRRLPERALGCSCGSGCINLFWISRIAEVDNQFHTDAFDDQWTYSLNTEDLLQSSYSAIISITLAYVLTLSVVRHQLPRPDQPEQWTSLKFRCRAMTTSMSCTNQLWSPVVFTLPASATRSQRPPHSDQ